MLASHIKLETLTASALAINAELFQVTSLSALRHRFRVVPTKPQPYFCREVHTEGGRKCYRVLDRYCPNPKCLFGASPSRVTHREFCRACKTETDVREFLQWRTSVPGFRPERRIYALCWHGFRDFFRECFSREPDAVFRTGLATWRGREHFEENYAESAFKNIGSQIYPCEAASACECQEYASAPFDYASRDTHRALTQINPATIDTRCGIATTFDKVLVPANSLPSCPQCRFLIRADEARDRDFARLAAERERSRKRLYFPGATGRLVMRPARR